MTNSEKFSRSEMSESQENTYLETIYDSHYDKINKSRYATKLAAEHSITRNTIAEVVNGKRTPTRIRSLILAASTIAAIFILAVFVRPLITGDVISAQQMAVSMIKKEQINVKRGAQEDSQLKLDFVTAFNATEYDKALQVLGGYSVIDSEDMYWKALALMYSERFTEAETTFKEINPGDDFKFASELMWNRALNAVVRGDQALAEELLRSVASSKWKSDDARRLLSKLSKK